MSVGVSDNWYRTVRKREADELLVGAVCGFV